MKWTGQSWMWMYTYAYRELTLFRLTGSLSPSNQGLAKIADVEHGWCLDIIPVLLGKGVHTALEQQAEMTVHSSAQTKIHKAYEVQGRLAASKPAKHALIGTLIPLAWRIYFIKSIHKCQISLTAWPYSSLNRAVSLWTIPLCRSVLK